MAKTKFFVIPAPGLGHIGSNTMLATTLLRPSETLSITVLLIDSPFGDEYGVAKKIACSNTNINYVHVPLAENSQGEKNYMSHLERHKANVVDVVKGLVSETDRFCFIVDILASPLVAVAIELDAKCYMFCTSGAANLGLCNFIATGPTIGRPGSEWPVRTFTTPVPISVLPEVVFSEVELASWSKAFQQIVKVNGIMVNTCAELEPYALRSFLDIEGFPPVYPIGPLMDFKGANQMSQTNKAEKARILSWMDEQEEESVLFLCFGHQGYFRTEQVKEIALGLEASGVKFVWALRKKAAAGTGAQVVDMEDPSEILPEGFISRIGSQGIVCGWAPQTEILGHPALGGFLTHCGWKSIVESLWFGVPTAAWPLSAEQQINAFYIVKELQLSVELKIDYRIDQEELVPASVIHNAVKSLIGNKELREKVKDVSRTVRKVTEESGSSFNAQNEVVSKMVQM